MKAPSDVFAAESRSAAWYRLVAVLPALDIQVVVSDRLHDQLRQCFILLDSDTWSEDRSTGDDLVCRPEFRVPGTVITWGSNSQEVVLPQRSAPWVPMHIDHTHSQLPDPNDDPVVDIDASMKIFVAATSSGKVYSWSHDHAAPKDEFGLVGTRITAAGSGPEFEPEYLLCAGLSLCRALLPRYAHRLPATTYPSHTHHASGVRL